MSTSRPCTSRPRRRGSVARLVATALVALGLVAATSTPASAVTPSPIFGGRFGTVPFNVRGDYVPLPLLCGEDLDILWYAPGSAADFVWSGIDLSGPSMSYTNRPTSISGWYKPLVGDFDGDACDDIFWYAPGTGADFIWYNDGASTFASRQVSVNGWYRPVVNFFDGNLTDDIYWYAPGAAAEAMWVGNTDRTMSSVRAPQVNGDYQPMPFMAQGVLWYGPGFAPDAITAVTAGRATPDLSYGTRVDQNFTAVPLWVTPLLYLPGPRIDYLVLDAAISGSGAELLMSRGSISGTYRIGTTAGGPVAVLHAPGPATDQLMFAMPEAAAASEGPTDWSHVRQRPADAATVLSAG